MEKFHFLASLPPIQSAISVSGQGDGARVKIDIPQSELEAILISRKALILFSTH